MEAPDPSETMDSPDPSETMGRISPLCSADSIGADWLDETVGIISPLDNQ